jgi:spermidine synthase
MPTITENAFQKPATDSQHSHEVSLVAGIALSSFAALLLELGLTRLFSVVLFYHFAFLAISIALLGLGAGGVFAFIKKNWLMRFETRTLVAALCTLNAVMVPLVLEVVLHLPVSLNLTGANFLRLTAVYICSAIPFFLTGLEFSVIFARESANIPRLYGADLLGGALACLAIVPLLNWIGGPNTILFAALMAAVAACVWTPSDGFRKLTTATAAALIILIAANHSGRLIDIVYAKGIFRDKSEVEFSRWNAISRVEVDRQAGGAKAVVIDADASTYIMNADLSQWQGSVWQKNLMSAPPALANVLRPHGEYAIIGPGGGVDVLRAVANGSPSVTGIEINPIIANTVMRGKYADYSYNLYQRPEVHIQVTDGRSFVRNSRQNYDVVQMTLVDTWASTAAGAFALSENSLYTVDAFREYFEHLKPDGMIAITRWEFRQPREALRVVSVAMEALHQLGSASPSRNFIVVSEHNLDQDGVPVVVLAKKTAFTAEEEEAVKAHLAENPALSALYLPSQPGENPFSALIASNNPHVFAENYAYNVSPVDDNAPFFFFTLKLKQMLPEQTSRKGIDWKVNLGVAVLGMVLIISALGVLTFLILP